MVEWIPLTETKRNIWNIKNTTHSKDNVSSLHQEFGLPSDLPSKTIPQFHHNGFMIDNLINLLYISCSHVFILNV